MILNTTSNKSLYLPALLGFATLLCGASPALAQTSPSLGDADSFAIFAGSTVTASPNCTIINGDVGVSPGTTLTGFSPSEPVMPPFSTHANDAEAIAAQISASALFTDLAAMTGGTPHPYELGGVTLTPGIYSFTTTAGIAAGQALTLDGAGDFVFQIGTTMTAAALSNVDLVNGATADQVFWQIGTTATLGGDTFCGTVVTGTTITLAAGAAVDGRLLAPSAGGTVTLAGKNTINKDDTPPADPEIGEAESFAVLAGSTLTAAGTGTLISGDAGVSPGLTITGFPLSAMVEPPYTTHANDGEAIAAQDSAAALLKSLACRPDATPLAYELGGLTLNPGTYSFATTAGIAAAGVLTLDGAGIYVFKVGTTMTAAALSSVDLVNGATSDEVFWAIGTTATLGGDMFLGTVITGTTITLAAGAAVNGRLLAPSAGGTVTLAGGNTVILPDTGPKVASIELVRLGTPANPNVFLPGQTSGPVTGEVWDPVVDHTTFMPGALQDIMGVSFTGPVNISFPGLGTLLCEAFLAEPRFYFTTPSTPFALNIPDVSAIVGLSLCTQAFSTDGISVGLTNALDITIGSF
jgi:hypothetical protein